MIPAEPVFLHGGGEEASSVASFARREKSSKMHRQLLIPIAHESEKSSKRKEKSEILNSW